MMESKTPAYQPDRLPLTLDRRKIYVFPTRYGLLFLLICSVMLLGSVNYDNNLGFLLSFLLFSMFFVSIFHTWSVLRGIRILSVGAHPVFVGESAVFEIVLDAGERMRPMLSLAIKRGNTNTADLLQGDFSRVRLGMKAHTRGLLKPESIRISTAYPLGLCSAWSYIYEPAECLVYPQPIFTETDMSVQFGEGQSHGAIEGKGSEDFKGIKPYQPGDPVRQIHWKAFSRGHGLMSKVFIGSAGKAVKISFYDLTEKNVELRLSILCGMVLTAHRKQQAYSLILPDQTLTADTGEVHRRNCLKALALFYIQ